MNNTAGLLDFPLGLGAYVAGLNDDWNGDAALAQQFCVAVAKEVDDWGGVGFGFAHILVALLGGNKGHEFIDVHDGLPVVVAEKMEVSHTNLTEVTGMVFVQVGTVVVLTTGKTTSTRVLAMLADTTVSSTDMASVLSRLAQVGGHVDGLVGVVEIGRAHV